MRRYIAAFFLCVSMSADGQSLMVPATGTTAKTAPGSNTSTRTMNIGGITAEKKNTYERLMAEALRACPECSSGGTVAGTYLIRGGNTDTSVPPLFYLSKEERIEIKRSEYRELKRKADAYDALTKTGRK